MRTRLFVCLLCGVWISPVQAFSTDSDDLQTTFHVEPAIADFSLSGTSEANIQHWLHRSAVQWAGEWKIIDTQTTESIIGVEASYLETLSPIIEEAPVIYELYYQQQWHNRYLVKPQIQYIQPHNSTLSTKEALVFGLSTEISF